MKEILKKFWPLLLSLAALAGLSLQQYSVLLSGGSCYFLRFFPGCDAGSISPFIVIAALIFIFGLCIFFYRGILLDWDWEKTGKADLRVIVAVAFAIILALAINQFTTGDPEYYFNLGRAAHYEINPYVQQYAGGNQFYSNEQKLMPVGVMYGPLMVRAFAGLYDLSSGNIYIFVLLLKLLCLLFFIICGYLIYESAATVGTEKKSARLLWLVAPLVLFEWLANAHFDGIWLVLILAAFLSAQNNKWWLVWPLIALAVWLKFMPILFLPIFALWWWQEIDLKKIKDIRDAISGVALSLIITVVAWSGLWQGLTTFQGLLIQTKWAAHSIFYVLYYGIAQLIGPANEKSFHYLLSGGLQAGLLLAALWFLLPFIVKASRIIWRKEKFSAGQFSLMIFVGLAVYLLLVQKSIWPWYFIWLLPFGLIAKSYLDSKRLRNLLIWFGTGPLLFYCLWFDASNMLGNYRFFSYAALIFNAYPLYQLALWRRENYSLAKDGWQEKISSLCRMGLMSLFSRAFHRTKPFHGQFIKYFATGVSAFVLDLATLFVFKECFGLTPTFAIVLNQILMLNFVFFLNKFWSFKADGITHHQMIRYFIVAGANYFFAIAWMFVFNHLLDFNYLIVRAANIVLAVSWNFLLYKFFVYKK